MRSIILFSIIMFSLFATSAYAGVIYINAISHTEPGHINVTSGGGTYWGNWRAYYNKSFAGTNDTPYVYVYVNSTVDNVTGWYVTGASSTTVFANATVNSTGWAALNMTGISLPKTMQLWASKGIDMQNSFIIQGFPTSVPSYSVNGSDRYNISITEPTGGVVGFREGVYAIYDMFELNKMFGTFMIIPYLIESPYWNNNTLPKNISFNEIGLHSHNGFWNHQQFGLDNRVNATDELTCFKDNTTLRTITNHDRDMLTSYFNVIPTSHAAGNAAAFLNPASLSQMAVMNELGFRVDASVGSSDPETLQQRYTIRNMIYNCTPGNFSNNLIPTNPYYFGGASNITNGTRGMMEAFMLHYGNSSDGWLNISNDRALTRDGEFIVSTFLHSNEVVNENGGYNQTSPKAELSDLNATIRLAKQYRAIFVTTSAVLFHPRSTETAAVAAQRINASTNTSATQWVWRLAVRNTNASAVNKIQLSPEWSRNDSFNITLPGQDVVELVYACEPQNSFSDPRYINKSAQPYIFTTGNVTINTCEYNSATGNYTVAFNGTGTNKVAYVYYNISNSFDVMDSSASNTSPVIEVRSGTVQATRNSFSATFNTTTNILNLTVPTMSDHFMQVLAYSAPQAVAATPSAAGTNAPVTMFSVYLKDGSKSQIISLKPNESFSTSFFIENKGNTTIATEISTNAIWAEVVPKSATVLPGQKREISVNTQYLTEGNYSFKVFVKVGNSIDELNFNIQVTKEKETEKTTEPIASGGSPLVAAALVIFIILFFVFRRYLTIK